MGSNKTPKQKKTKKTMSMKQLQNILGDNVDLIAKLVKKQAKENIDKETGRIGRRTKSLFNDGFLGLKPDTCYWDPRGFQVKGGVNLCMKYRDALLPAFEAFDKAVDEHKPMPECVEIYRREARKTLVSSTWNIPIFAVPGVPIVKPGAQPFASLIPRVAIDKDQVQTTPLTTVQTSADIAETDETYTFSDPVYHDGTVSDYTFDVKGYGVGNKISELMSLVGGAIQNPRQSLAESELVSVRRKEEYQMFQGTNYSANGFSGFYDFAAATGGGANVNNSTAVLTAPDDIRSMLNTLIVDNSADRDSMVAGTDKTTFTGILNDLQDYVRTGNPYKNFVALDPDNGINVKIKACFIDDVPIFPTMGAPTTDDVRELIAADFSFNYMAMVQDAVLKPLAKLGPFEQMATDAYGCLVSRGFARVGRIYNIGQ